MTEPKVPLAKKTVDDLEWELDAALEKGNEKKARRIVEELAKRERTELKWMRNQMQQRQLKH